MLGCQLTRWHGGALNRSDVRLTRSCDGYYRCFFFLRKIKETFLCLSFLADSDIYEKSADGRDDSDGYLFDGRYRFRSIPHQHAVSRTLDNSKNPPTPSLTTSRWFQIQIRYYLFSPLFGEDFQFDWFFFRWVETTNQLRVCLWKCIWPLRFECFVQLVQAHKMILTRSWGWGVQRSRPGPIVPGVWVYQWPLSPARPYAAVFLPSSRDVCRRNASEAKNLVNGGFGLQSHRVFMMTIHWTIHLLCCWKASGEPCEGSIMHTWKLGLVNETTAHCNVWLVVNVPWFMLLLPTLLDPMPAGFLPSNHVIASSRNSFAPVPEMEAKQRLVISDSIAETQSKYEGNISSRWWIVYGSSCQLPKEVQIRSRTSVIVLLCCS